MGCFVFTAHRHIWGPPTEFQDMKLWPQGQRQEGNLRPLSPALGTKMWLVPVSFASCWYSRDYRILTRLNGQKG